MSSPVVAKAKSQLVAALPQFVIENHQKFISFLRAYYEWSASEGPDLAFGSMKMNNDIDLVLEELLFGYKNTFAKQFPGVMATDFRHFSKFLKEFYQIKGSPESYRIFFNAIFGVNSSVIFPREFVLKPSESVWNRIKYFKLSPISGDLFTILDQEIIGRLNGYKCTIFDIVKEDGKFNAYFDSNSSSGDFEVGEIIQTSDGSIKAEVVPMFGIQSITSSASWHDLDLIQTNNVILKVDKVRYGYIQSLTLVSGGTGYAVDDTITTTSEYSGTGFEAKVTGVDGSGTITTWKITRKGFGYTNEAVTFVVASVGGTGASFTPAFNADFRKIQSLSFVKNVEYTDLNPTVTAVVSGTTIVFEPVVYNTQRYWSYTQSEPSSSRVKIHDSSYYQEFSYELQSTAVFKEYETQIKDVLGIAGLKLFCKELIQDSAVVLNDTSLSFA